MPETGILTFVMVKAARAPFWVFESPRHKLKPRADHQQFILSAFKIKTGTVAFFLNQQTGQRAVFCVCRIMFKNQNALTLIVGK